MPDPIARKPLKKKMLCRRQNEAERLPPHNKCDANGPTSENKGQRHAIVDHRYGFLR